MDVKRDAKYSATVRGQIWGSLNKSFAPDSKEALLIELKEKAKNSKQRFNRRTRMAEAKATVRPISIDDFSGYLLESEVSVGGGWWNPNSSAFANSTAWAEGWVFKGNKKIFIEYKISGEGSANSSLNAFLSSQTKAGQSDAQAILAGLHLTNNGDFSSTPYDGPKLDGSDMLQVSLSAFPEAPAFLGQTVEVAAAVSGGKPPYSYTWSGDHGGKGATVLFGSRKEGEHQLSVTVTDARGDIAADEITIQVKALDVTIRTLHSVGPTIFPGVPVELEAEITNSKNNKFEILWQPHPEISFDPFESLNATESVTKATFPTVGTYKVWAQVYFRDGESPTLVGESEQFTIEAVSPDITLSADNETPYVGDKVIIQIQVDPKIEDEHIKFWWEIKGGKSINAGPEANIPNNRAYSFIPISNQPGTVTVHAVAKIGGADLGEASISINPEDYSIVPSEPKRMDRAPWKWDPTKGTAVEMPLSIAVFQDAEVHAIVTPKPKEKLRYRWTVTPEGCSISAPMSQSTNLNAHETGTYVVSVKVSDENGIQLGSGTTSYTVTVSQNDLDVVKQKEADQKEAQKLLEEGRKDWKEGRLEQAITKIERAQKLAEKNEDIFKTLDSNKRDKKEIDDKLTAASDLIKQGKLNDAEKALSKAAKINDKYEKYKELSKRLIDARKKAKEEKKQLEKLLKDAETLEDAGKLDELVAVLKKGSTQFPDNKEIADQLKEVQGQQEDALKKMKEGQAQWEKGELDIAVSTLKEASKIDPSNDQIAKDLKGMQDQKKMMDDAITEADKLLEQEKIEQAKSVLNNVGSISSKYPPYVEILKKYEKAITEANQVKKILADAKQEWINGQSQSAIDKLDDILKIDSDNTEAINLKKKWQNVLDAAQVSDDSIIEQPSAPSTIETGTNSPIANPSVTVKNGIDGLSLKKSIYEPGEKIMLDFTASTKYPDRSWIGMFNASLTHGTVAEVNNKELAYEYLRGKSSGIFEFTAPQEEGKYDFRILETSNGREVATLQFKVRVNREVAGLKIEKATYEPREKIMLNFTASAEYPDKSWIGMFNASLAHGTVAEVNNKELAYEYLYGKSSGLFEFTAPQKEGEYDFRILETSNGLEVATLQFKVRVNRGNTSLKINKATYEPGEKIMLNFTASAQYRDKSWIGMFNASLAHGTVAEVNNKELAYEYLQGKSSGLFEFTAPQKEGEYDFRMLETSSGLEVATLQFKVNELNPDGPDSSKPVTSDNTGSSTTEPTTPITEQTISAEYGPPSSANTWARYSIPLTADNFGVDAQTFQEVLSNVSAMRIRTEMHNGNDVGGIDAVKIGNMHVSDFDDGTNAWNAAGDGTMEWVSSEGMTGGYLQISDWASGDWHWAVAPASWSGNWQRLIGSTIDFYYKTDHPSFSAVVEISNSQQNRLGLVAKPLTILPESSSSLTISPYPISSKDLGVSLTSSNTKCITVIESTVVFGGQTSFESKAQAVSGASDCSSVIEASSEGYGESRITMYVKGMDQAAQEPITQEIDNIWGVTNNPRKPTTFQIDTPVKLLYLKTYHWNNGRGKSPGSIGLRHNDGTLYGLWQSSGLVGQNGVQNAYWEVKPNVPLEPGVFTVVDSDPETWSTNEKAGWMGFATIRTEPITIIAGGNSSVSPVSSQTKGSEYRVVIDNCHSSIINEGTNNTISVEFINGNNVVKKISKTSIKECSSNATFSIQSNENITGVNVTTTGEDGFYIDKIELYKGGVLAKRYGSDNGKGWCLSTDPGDANGSWEGTTENGCKASQYFGYTSSVSSQTTGSEYKVVIDNCNSGITNEGTNNTIGVEFLNGNNVVEKISKTGIQECSSNAIFSIQSNENITGVNVTSNGEDGFHIDKIELYKGRELAKRYGNDNGKGWCLSTDPGDASGAWKGTTENGCKASQFFGYASAGVGVKTQ